MSYADGMFSSPDSFDGACFVIVCICLRICSVVLLSSVHITFNFFFIFSYLQTFRTPLGLKYACPSQSTWHLAINSLMSVLSVGLPLARKNGMWTFCVAIYADVHVCIQFVVVFTDKTMLLKKLRLWSVKLA